MLTASQLFAGTDAGEALCYYCGGPCAGELPTKEYVKSTFTNRDIVARPGSEYVCRSCVESLSSKMDIELVDGEQRAGQRVRQYSWIITRERRLAATKAHIETLRDAVLSPPGPPFVIILADSGQKQLVFRAPVAWSTDVYPVMLEEETILVDPQELRQRIELAKRVAAATGKPALLEPITSGTAIRVDDYHGTVDPLVEWEQIQAEPLSRLAAWLCPAKQECQNEYPQFERGGVSAEARRVRGRVKSDDAGDQRGSQGRDNQIRLDLG